MAFDLEFNSQIQKEVLCKFLVVNPQLKTLIQMDSNLI